MLLLLLFNDDVVALVHCVCKRCYFFGRGRLRPFHFIVQLVCCRCCCIRAEPSRAISILFQLSFGRQKRDEFTTTIRATQRAAVAICYAGRRTGAWRVGAFGAARNSHKLAPRDSQTLADEEPTTKKRQRAEVQIPKRLTFGSLARSVYLQRLSASLVTLNLRQLYARRIHELLP